MSELKNVHTGIDRSKVRFASRLKLIKPIELSKAEYEKQLTLCLYENYPGLRFHIMKANEINEKYYKDYPEFRIRFQPNFTCRMMGLIGASNNPMVGMTVACAVAVNEALNK